MNAGTTFNLLDAQDFEVTLFDYGNTLGPGSYRLDLHTFTSTHPGWVSTDTDFILNRRQLEELYTKLGNYLKDLDFQELGKELEPEETDDTPFEVEGIPFPKTAADMGF